MPRRLGARARGDTGAATTTSLVLLTPVLTLMLFAAFQAALWNHARAEARAAARITAALVARSGAAPGDAEADTEANLRTRTDLEAVDVRIVRADGRVVVTVTGRAPGIVIGTSAPVRVEVAVPIEGWSPL
jgi:hypothetical protein